VVTYFDKTYEELKAWDQAGVVHPDDLPAAIAARTYSISTGEPYDIEQRNLGADGIFRWFQMLGVPLKDPDGRIIGWSVLENDVDERKRAQEGLPAGERNLKAIINLLATASWSTLPNGYCDFLSDIYLEYTGYSSKEAEGWSWGKGIHPQGCSTLFTEGHRKH
jgi:PAS domain-containing protein